MHTEYEVKVLEIDKNSIIQKLERLGAIKVGEWDQKRYVYDIKPADPDKWIRLRTNGETTTLTYKQVVKNSIDGTKEVEIIVNDFAETNIFLESIGYKAKAYQENRRIQYKLDNIEIDIDTWPQIPSYLEIEGENETTVLEMLKKLELDNNKVTALSTQDIYISIYNIDITKIDILKF